VRLPQRLVVQHPGRVTLDSEGAVRDLPPDLVPVVTCQCGAGDAAGWAGGALIASLGPQAALAAGEERATEPALSLDSVLGLVLGGWKIRDLEFDHPGTP
jgi:hypothetical protein